MGNHSTPQRALVTGASSGIGREMARQLAARGCNLVVAARRLDRLEELAAELTEAHKVQVEPIASDLSQGSAPAALYAAATASAPLDILINNAGFGVFSRAAHADLQRTLDMVAVNVRAVVELSHLFVRDAVARDSRAYVLNIGSTAAFQPVPFFAHYAATKHYVLAFSEAMAHELAATNVSVTCLCPGATRTEFFDTSEQALGTLAEASMLSAERVARIGLKAMFKGRRSVVSGGANKLGAWLTRLVPRRTAGTMAAWVLGDPDAGGRKQE